MNIKPDQIIAIIDGPFYAPNFKRTVRVIRPSDVISAWVCVDFKTGESLIVQESKLLESLRSLNQPELPFTAEQEQPPTNPS